MKEEPMIDIVIRAGASGHWMPLIVVTDTQEELYRGEYKSSAQDALDKALSVWRNRETGNIVDFKEKQARLAQMTQGWPR